MASNNAPNLTIHGRQKQRLDRLRLAKVSPAGESDKLWKSSAAAPFSSLCGRTMARGTTELRLSGVRGPFFMPLQTDKLQPICWANERCPAPPPSLASRDHF